MKRLITACLLSASLMACGGTPADTEPPSLTGPLDAQEVNHVGIHPIVVHASDNAEVTRVEFYRDGQLMHVDSNAPFTWPLEITPGMNGSHTVKAIAYDATGNTTEVQWQVNVNVPAPLISVPLPDLAATIPTLIEVPANAEPPVIYALANQLEGVTLPAIVRSLVGSVTLSGTVTYDEATPGTSDVRKIGVFVRSSLDPLPPDCSLIGPAVICAGSEIGQQVGTIDFTRTNDNAAAFVLGGPVLRNALTSDPARLHLGFQVLEGKLNEGDVLRFTNLQAGAGL